MENKIRLTESQLKQMIQEGIKKVLSEMQRNNMDVFELSTDFQIMVDRLKEMAWQLDGFIKEYQVFRKAVLEHTQRLGLTLINASIPHYFDWNDLVSGRGVEYEYEFGFGQNIDINAMSDEEYDAWQEKVESIGGDLEIEINPRNFKF